MESHSLPDAFDRQDAILAVLEREPSGLITDFDGTISLIASTPEEARIYPGTRQALERLSRRLRLVSVVSGRSASDVRALVGLEELVYVANHGLERWENGAERIHPDARPYKSLIKGALDESHGELAGRIPGLRFEDKGITASIHYRLAADQGAARSAILDTLARIKGADELTVTEGRLVVEVRPPVRIDKGAAVLGLIADYQLRGVVFLGDDRTDVDAMRALKARVGQYAEFAGLSIAVSSAEGPPEMAEVADLGVGGVPEVGRLLMWIADELDSR